MKLYQFKEEINYVNFFLWDRKLIENYNWALLSKASKTVFPPIACHCNEAGNAFPGEQTIAILSGLTEKTARKGINDLEDFPGFKFMPYTTKRGKRSKKFHIKLPKPGQRGRSFGFHKCILESGNWLMLNPVGQALYSVMRFFSTFDIEVYYELYSDELDSTDFEDIYPVRKSEFCEANMRVMADHAGIHMRSMNTALDSLHKNNLIKWNDRFEVWEVILKPKTYWKRDYLNKRVLERYKEKDEG
ncbi:MAG: hypothetical protein P9X24_06055 [Candidatus Hatepunaea meridiana]|nr:hypothetical protein [Candidatus Hatepunaea meridiana]